MALKASTAGTDFVDGDDGDDGDDGTVAVAQGGRYINLVEPLFSLGKVAAFNPTSFSLPFYSQQFLTFSVLHMPTICLRPAFCSSSFQHFAAFLTCFLDVFFFSILYTLVKIGQLLKLKVSSNPCLMCGSGVYFISLKINEISFNGKQKAVANCHLKLIVSCFVDNHSRWPFLAPIPSNCRPVNH